MSLSPYQQDITKYNSAARKLAEKGGKPWLHKGKSDIFRVFCKRGALGNISIVNRLNKHWDIDTFIRKSRRNNFNEVAKWIAANVCLATRTFSLSGTQCQIAKDLEISQPTVHRILDLMIRMDVIGHAFPGEDVTRSVVGDKQGVPLNNVYIVREDFGYLAGKTAGDKFKDALAHADEKAQTETATTLKERLATIRSTLWEGTIERRIRNITEGCYRKSVKKLTDRFLASRIILRRMKKRGEDQFLNDRQLERYINSELKYCGFGG